MSLQLAICFDSIHLHLLEFSLRVLFVRRVNPYLNGNAPQAGEVGAGRAGAAACGGYGYVRALRVFHSSDLWAAPGFDNDSNFERFEVHPTYILVCTVVHTYLVLLPHLWFAMHD